MGDQLAQPPDVQVHRLTPTRRRDGPTTSPACRRRTAIGTRLDVNRLDQIGLLTVPAPIAGQTAFNAFVQPLHRSLRLRRERREGRRRHGRLRDDVRRGQFLPRRRSDRLQRDLRRRDPPRAARRLSALRRRRGSDPQLERLGLDHRAGRASALQRHADLLHRRLPAAGRRAGAGDPLRVPVAELRAERHDPLEATGRSTPGCSPATTRCTARDCARIRRSR